MIPISNSPQPVSLTSYGGAVSTRVGLAKLGCSVKVTCAGGAAAKCFQGFGRGAAQLRRGRTCWMTCVKSSPSAPRRYTVQRCECASGALCGAKRTRSAKTQSTCVSARRRGATPQNTPSCRCTRRPCRSRRAQHPARRASAAAPRTAVGRTAFVSAGAASGRSRLRERARTRSSVRYVPSSRAMRADARPRQARLPPYSGRGAAAARSGRGTDARRVRETGGSARREERCAKWAAVCT